MNMKKAIYFSTFTSGLGGIIEPLLKKKLKSIKIIKLFDGGILYETAGNVSQIGNFEFLNNSFLVLFYLKQTTSMPFQKVIQGMLEKKISFNKSLQFKSREFKLFFSNENQFESVDRNIKNGFEALIRKNFHMSYIPSSSKKTANEFWVLRRSENYCFLMLRISENNEKPMKGELRRELAYIMAYLSKPSPEDKFIDPFAGYGSIPLLRLASPFKRMCILDIEQPCVEFIRKKINAMKIQRRGDIFIGQQDFFKTSLQENYFNKIVSDPPWGTFSKMDNIEDFYAEMFDKFLYILAEEGLIVLLVERKLDAIVERILRKQKDQLILDVKFEILLSGRKATIYRIIKKTQKHHS